MDGTTMAGRAAAAGRVMALALWAAVAACGTSNGSLPDARGGEIDAAVIDAGLALARCELDNGGCDPLVSCSEAGGEVTCGDCPAGYAGEGDAACVDIDECLVDNGGCDPLVACTNLPGDRGCGPCPVGYDGDGEAGCVDIDECADGTDLCDDLVTCADVDGGYLCGDCPLGYAGGGLEGCVDIDECQDNNGNCDPLTTCTNEPGTRTCGACPPGYTGDGETGCFDINECLDANGGCHRFASCENTPGSRTCACLPGYLGDGEADCARENLIANGDFDDDLTGWITVGCGFGFGVTTDDEVHGKVMSQDFPSACTMWQAVPLDVAAQSSVRLRLDLKPYTGFGSGQPTIVRVYAGTAPPYNQALLGEHTFADGEPATTEALSGATTTPPGVWSSWTSEDLRPLAPPGTSFLRVDIVTASNVVRVDNILAILNDPTVPVATLVATPSSGHADLDVVFAGACDDGGDACSALFYDYGNGPTNTPAGWLGTTTVGADGGFIYPTGTWRPSFTAEDASGAAHTVFATITASNAPPTTSPSATPPSGPAPLAVAFDAGASDDVGVVAYAWNFGDGTTSTAAAPSHTYASPGTYVASVTVTDGNGASASGSVVIVATGSTYLVNGDFEAAGVGWVYQDAGWCFQPPFRTDDAAHGTSFHSGACVADLWQTAAIDVDGLTSLRLRVDSRRLWPDEWNDSLSVELAASSTTPSAMVPIGTHRFIPGALAENDALSGDTATPPRTWYAWTSRDLRPLLPAGTRFIRVRVTNSYTASFGGPVDNIMLIADDAELPTGTMSGTPTSGHAPVTVDFTSTCSDPDGCAAVVWSFGDAPENAGGSSAVGAAPSFTYPQNRTYHASAILADGRGAARTLYQQVSFTNAAPTTAISASVASGPAPLAVTFDAHAADDFGIASYSWSFGDGGTSTDVAPSHTYASAGTYVARVTVVDTDGASASSAMTIVVTGTRYLVDGGFDDDGEGWVFDGGGCGFGGPIVVDNAAHDRTLRSGSCGQQVWQVAAVETASLTSLRLRLDVRPYPDFGSMTVQVWGSTTSPDAMVLAGTHTFDSGTLEESMALTGATRSPAQVWYAWTSDDMLAALPAGTTFVKVVLSGFGGPWGAALVDNATLIADDADVPSGELLATPTSGDAPLLVDFGAGCTDLSGSCVGTTWDFGDGAMFSPGSSSTQPTPSFTYVGNQTYTVSLVVEDDDGAARTVLASISTVNAPPTASAAGAPLVGPGPLAVTFDGTAADSDGSIASVAWNFGDGGSSGLEDPTYTFLAQGTYVVTFTATDNEGAFASDSIVVIVQ